MLHLIGHGVKALLGLRSCADVAGWDFGNSIVSKEK